MICLTYYFTGAGLLGGVALEGLMDHEYEEGREDGYDQGYDDGGDFDGGDFDGGGFDF